MSTEDGLFLRRVSGLRRSASALDVFIFNTGLISVGLAVAFNAFYLPAFYPSARVDLSSIIATGLMLLAGFGFYLWAVLLPRSGGNYVFMSRTFHPGIGFLASWMESSVLLFYTAVASALIVRIGFATVLGGVGAVTSQPQLVQLGQSLSGEVPTFLGGSLVIIFCTAVLCRGMRLFFLVQKVMFALALVGTVALSIVLMGVDSDVIASRLASHFPGFDASAAVNLAKSKGWTIDAPSLAGSLSAIGWPLLPLAGGVLSIGIGAEIQRARRSQLIGIMGSIAFSGLVLAGLGAQAESAVGRTLLGAISYASTQNLGEAVPGGVPWLHFIVAVIADNVVVSLLVGLGIIAWIYLWIPGMLAYCNRCFLAWSLDRIAPSWLGEVSPIRQTPVNGSILGGGIAIVFLAAYIWVPPLQGLVIFQVLMFTWSLSLFGGAVFPFLRARLYDAAAAGGAVVPRRPLFSIAMTIGAIALFVAGMMLWNDPVAAGHSPLAIGALLTIVVTGTIFYLTAAAIRRRQGVDVSRSFREIPIE